MKIITELLKRITYTVILLIGIPVFMATIILSLPFWVLTGKNLMSLWTAFYFKIVKKFGYAEVPEEEI